VLQTPPYLYGFIPFLQLWIKNLYYATAPYFICKIKVCYFPWDIHKKNFRSVLDPCYRQNFPSSDLAKKIIGRNRGEGGGMTKKEEILLRTEARVFLCFSYPLVCPP
jgi:hypothetical protein